MCVSEFRSINGAASQLIASDIVFVGLYDGFNNTHEGYVQVVQEYSGGHANFYANDIPGPAPLHPAPSKVIVDLDTMEILANDTSWTGAMPIEDAIDLCNSIP